MQLLNMEVDRFGARGHLHLGQFSPGLNAVYGPHDSGRATLLRWLRNVACETPQQNAVAYPTAVLDGYAITGEVQWLNRGASFRVAQGNDGRINYARTGSRAGDQLYQNREYLSPQQRSAFVALLEAIDGRDNELELTSIAQRLQLCRTAEPDSLGHRERLVAREQELMRLLDATPNQGERSVLIRRRDELQLALQRWTAYPPSELAGDHRRLGHRFEVIEGELHSRLKEVEELDREIADVRERLAKADAAGEQGTVPEISESYRRQLRQLDDRLNRWRQTLRDLKAHRERVEHNSTDVRLDQQIGDQLGATKHADPRAALRSLEAQILNTRRQLDALVDRYGADPVVLHDAPRMATEQLRRDVHGRTSIAYYDQQSSLSVHMLPDTLRSMQKDLHEVCQQLARHEASTAAETLRQQSLQLQRCEAELLQSVEKLIDERATLLRKIAADHHLTTEQLSMAFGNWCQCHDHLSVHDWLLQEDVLHCPTHRPTESRESLLAELRRMEGLRSQASARCDECRRQLRECDLLKDRYTTPRYESNGEHSDVRLRELSRELEAILADLAAMDRGDQLRAELARVREELAQLPERYARDEFRQAVDRHIVGLVGNDNRRFLPRYQGSYVDMARPMAGRDQSRFSEYNVPAPIVQLAMRLAIVEGLAVRNEHIPLIVDGNLDGMPHALQGNAVHYLGSRIVAGQQIILLTGDQAIVDMIRNRGGYVGILPDRIEQRPIEQRPVVQDWDINRQLAAYANEDELTKWSVPIPQAPSPSATKPHSEYYLSERSNIEDLPSIDATTAARCRALGIDRVGDLLDVDPHWLADNMRLGETTPGTVMDWQAEARLLCSVRNLRPFDARVLIGADIRSPKQLSEMHPSHLLDRVERFLATERGRDILRSGTRYELSRITSWIAAAKNNVPRYHRSSTDEDVYQGDDYEPMTRVYAPNRRDYGHAAAEHTNMGRSHSTRADRESYSHRELDREPREYARSRRNPRPDRDSTLRHNSAEMSEAERQARRAQRKALRRSEAPAERSNRSQLSSERQSERRSNVEVERRRSDVRLAETDSNKTNSKLRFYLDVSSPVEDAPSIGPRMAERLEQSGIRTVAQLLAASPDAIADQLQQRKVTTSVVRQWQDQARLVCRIPNLRGHDAQLLVACDITSPEALASMDANNVLHQVSAVAASAEGQRILRGSATPDLDEVHSWIAWAKQCRSLHAA